MANLESSPQKPRRSRPPRTKERSMPNRDVDLTSGFRLDAKTFVLIAALVGAWYDQRSQATFMRQALEKMAAKQELQSYEMTQIKIALAAKGVIFPKGD